VGSGSGVGTEGGTGVGAGSGVGTGSGPGSGTIGVAGSDGCGTTSRGIAEMSVGELLLLLGMGTGYPASTYSTPRPSTN